MILQNDFISVQISNEGFPFVESLENRMTGKKVTFDKCGFAVIAGEGSSRMLSEKHASQIVINTSENTRLEADAHLACEKINLGLKISYSLGGPSLHLKYEITNRGNEAVYIKDVVMLNCSVDALTESQYTGYDLNAGEAHFLDSEDNDRVDAHPVFIGNHLFCGIDWPVAENAGQEGRMMCRQFLGDMLEPGATLKTRQLTIGAAKEGRVAEAFMEHLERLRGRETKRSSMYFTWLNHAWEGLTEEEFGVQTAFLHKLYEQYGLRFDMVLGDAGIVETLHTYYDKYRLRQEQLIPGGLKQFTDRLAADGSFFGIWLGPDGFGETPEEAEDRMRTVTNMVRDWNVGIIKFDCAVSAPLGKDRYRNEHYMRKLEELMRRCREINPGLIVINHRITVSPYILGILDSTLWEGMEMYPDVYLVNSDKPRLFTRFAAYGRGEPTYYGIYSKLLEDHGICFNGEHYGWAEEFVVQTFGRALLLSPEVYGTLFLLPDGQYAEMSRLMKLAEQLRPVMEHSRFDERYGAFIHSNGMGAVLCMINDSWEDRTVDIPLNADLGIKTDCEAFEVRMYFPAPGAGEDNRLTVKDNGGAVRNGGTVKVRMHPFAVSVIEIAPVDEEVGSKGAKIDAESSDSKKYADIIELATLASLKDASWSIHLGSAVKHQVNDKAEATAERIRFMISSDPTEAQAISRLPASIHDEVNESRRLFMEKMRKCGVISDSAWDEKADTAWGDYFHWKNLSNCWRLDLGRSHEISRIEVKLADFGPGAVIDGAKGRRLEEPVIFEVSEDGLNWRSARAILFNDRIISRLVPGQLIADFGQGVKARYIRMNMRGVMVSDIKVKEYRNGKLAEVERNSWKGNNLLTARKPQAIYTIPAKIEKAADGQYIALIASLPGNARVPLHQETAIAWAEAADGQVWPALLASPVYPFNGWENNTYHKGNAWTFRIPAEGNMAGKDLALNLAWYGPCYDPDNIGEIPLPEVTGYIVTIRDQE